MHTQIIQVHQQKSQQPTHLPLCKSAVPGLKPLHSYGTHAFYQVKVVVNAEACSVPGAVLRFHPWGGRCHTVISRYTGAVSLCYAFFLQPHWTIQPFQHLLSTGPDHYRIIQDNVQLLVKELQQPSSLVSKDALHQSLDVNSIVSTFALSASLIKIRHGVAKRQKAILGDFQFPQFFTLGSFYGHNNKHFSKRSV